MQSAPEYQKCILLIIDCTVTVTLNMGIIYLLDLSKQIVIYELYEDYDTKT